ncbi:hypothetical protein [Helcococcus kunzii]|uniref:hypothetical protein n=1 Tax=Helcococcus kunzii TaxID=40091 RepID=UPI0024AD61B6|nr:hypothetical protein [Helcococcus kunzii]
MKINVYEELKKLKSQKEFILLIFLFLITFPMLTINGVNDYNDKLEDERAQDVSKYISNYQTDLKSSIDNLRDKINSPQIRFNELLKSSINRQADEYEKLSNSQLSLALNNQNGILFLNDTSAIDNLLLSFIFFIGFLIFDFDRKNKTNSLISTIKNGGKNKSISKLSLYFLICLVIAIVTYSLYVVYISQVIGFGDTSLNIQSFVVFRDANLNITIQQYIILFILQKILTIIFTLSIFSLIFCFFKDSRIELLVAIIFVLVSYLAKNNITNNSVFEFIKASSIYTMFDIFSIYGKYSDVYLFYTFLDTRTYIFIFSAITIILTLFISYKLNKNEIIDKEYIPNLNIINKLKIKSLFFNEFIRLIFDSKGLIALFIIVLVSISLYPKKEREQYDYFRYTYIMSLNEFKGKINQNKLDRLESKKLYYDSLAKEAEKIEESFDKGEINYKERDIRLSKIDEENAKYEGFEQVYNQAYTAYERSNGKNNLYLVDKKISEYNFEYNFYIFIFSAISYLILIFVVSEVFFKDSLSKMNLLIKSSKNGHLKVLKERIILSFLYGMLIIFIIQIILYIYSKANNLEVNLHHLTQSYTSLLNLPSIKLIYIFIFYLIYSSLNIFFFINFIIFINLKIKKRASTYIILLALSILPLVLSMISRSINILSLNIFSNAFTSVFTLTKHGIYGLVFESILLILMSIILINQNKKYWLRKI